MRNDSVLIVDDEAVWRDIYTDSVRKLGIDSIRAVDSLAEAKHTIDCMKFAVAIVDIGLDKNDETNVDGLSVMAKLRSVGDDDTSVIVITGRTGSDVIDVVSTSIQKYGAAATFAKGKLKPELLQSSVERALQAHREKSAIDRIPVYSVLLHGDNQMVWDYSMMQVLGIEGGAHIFYDFLETLLKGYLPLLSSENDNIMATDLHDGIAHGAFWSRALGQAIVVSLGQQLYVDRAVLKASLHGQLYGQYRVGNVLSEYSLGRSKGVVHSLMDRDRLEFGDAEVARGGS
jgi:CheY-like chemotaxis protein